MTVHVADVTRTLDGPDGGEQGVNTLVHTSSHSAMCRPRGPASGDGRQDGVSAPPETEFYRHVVTPQGGVTNSSYTR